MYERLGHWKLIISLKCINYSLPKVLKLKTEIETQALFYKIRKLHCKGLLSDQVVLDN